MARMHTEASHDYTGECRPEPPMAMVRLAIAGDGGMRTYAIADNTNKYGDTMKASTLFKNEHW